MIKRIVSMVMAVLMVISLLPLSVFAEDGETGCTCTVKCSEGAMDGNCPVCSVEGALPETCAFQAEETEDIPPVCTCTAKCGEGAMNGECPVCGAEGAQLDACVGQPEAPQPVPHVCTCTAKCGEGAMNGECPVCGVEGAQLDACLGQSEAPQPVPPVCNCTAKCAEGAMDENCPVCRSVPSACTGRAQEPEEVAPVCDCEIKCQKDAVCDTCPICAADFRVCTGEDYSISLLLSGDIDNGSSVSYCKNGTTVDVHGGNYGEQGYKKTTYDNGGYKLVTSGLSGATVSVSPSFVNEERYVKLAYTVTNSTSLEINGMLGIYADVQIGSDDFATVSVITNRNGTPIGLKMVENDTNAQFNLYFAGTGGVTNTDRYWFGYYNKADDHCLDKLTESTKDAGTGSRAGSYENDLSKYVGGDSGLAISWNVSVPAGESKTYSCIVGVGEAAAPPEWSDTAPVALTMSAEATKENLKLYVTAKVKDAENVVDTLFYSVNGGAETQLGDCLGDGLTEQEITGVIDLTNQPDGTYTYLFWIVNDKGASSEAVERTITITNGRVSGDVSMPTCNGNHKWEENWTSDAENHWHTCERVWCDAQKDLAAHQWKLTGITVSAQDNQFYEHSKCEVCQRTKEEPHTHRYTYSASGAVITESCSYDLCNHSATATIYAPTNLDYDGTAKEATVSYSDGWQGGELNITYAPADPVNAGQVTASITKDNAAASVGYTIAKAPVSFTVSNNTHSYDGTGKTATVTQTAGQTPAIGSQFTVSYKQSGTTVTPKNVGSYEIWVTLTSSNFKFDGKADTIREMQVGTLTISTAAYPQIDWPEAGSLTYGQTLADSTLTGSESGGIFRWKEPTTIPTVANNGYTVVFTPDDSGYQGAEQTISITVSPKELTITDAAAINRDYEPGNTAVTVSDGTLEGIVTGDSVTLVATGVSGKVASADAGQNKPVTVTGYALDGSDKGNYTLVQPDNVTVTITPAVGSGSVTMADWTYGDAARNPVPTSGTNGTANISYRYTNRTGTPNYDSVTCPTDAGDYTVTATFAATNNYRQVTATADFTISKATPAIGTKPTASDITYGQSLRDSTLTGGAAKNPNNSQISVPGRFTWDNGEETPTACGSISRNVNFTPDDTRNYNSTSTTITLTVNKATPDAPGAGDGYTIDYAGETITIDAGYEVFTAQTGGTPITGSISDYVGSTIYVRKAGTDTHTPSDWTAISVPTRPNVPSTPRVVNRSDTSITVSTVEGQEYSLDGRIWQTGGTFTGLAASTEYTVYTRVKATGSSFASVRSSVSVTTKVSAPDAPEVSGSYAVSTADGSKFTYTVTAVPGAEYSLDGVSWQDGNVFDNLAPEGSYTFYVRFKETDTAMAGNAGSETVILRKLTTGSGSVTMDGWIYGETAKEPKPSSTTHGTGSVTYRYKGRNSTSSNESGECPTEAGDYTVTATFAATAVYESVTAEANFTIAKATLTPSVATVDSKIYDGSTAATGTLTLSGMVNGENPEATGTFAFADKNVGENKAVNVTDITLDDTWDVNYQLSTDKLYNVSTTAAINPKSLSVENVTVKNKPFDGTKDAEFQGTPSLSGVVEGDDVTLKNGTPSFKSDAVGVQTVYFTDFSLEGVDAANYSLTQPASVTAEITLSEKHLDLSGITTEEGGQIPNEVFIDGSPYPICGEGENAYLALSEGSILLTTHTEAITGEPGEMNKPYPDTMRVYRIVEKKDASGNVIGNEVEEISALYDLLKYAGCSIRIDGIQGIRMITSIDQSNKEKLLRQEGLAGYQLVEYGTVVSWANENANPTLTDCLKKGVAYGVGDRGVFQDPVFGVSGGRVQYTNVLINFTMEQCAQELAMRPYIILKDADGEQITLYGGTVVRSIGYIAYQNRNVFQPGSGEYQYVWQIIHGVYGERFDETTQENGGNNG